MIQAIMAGNNLAYTAVVDIIKLINVVIGKKALPETEYYFRKVCTSKIQFEKQFFCKSCNHFFGSISGKNPINCPSCEKNDKEYFITTPIKDNLITIVKENFDVILAYREKVRSQPEGIISDISNGLWIKNLNIEEDFLTININSDGVAPFNSSIKTSLWPILITLNDLPPAMRNQKKNMLTSAFWMSETPLIVDMFFKTFIVELKSLFENGISVKGKKFKIIVAACCVDSVARSKILCMKQFNGSFGCTYCLHPATGQKYLPMPQVKLRDLDQFHNCIEEWNRLSETEKHKGIAIFGVKGKTVLLDIPLFNPIIQTPVDFMHCVLLGVVKTMLSLWLTSKNSHEKYYINTNKRLLLEKKLLSLKTYSECTRKPRPISDYKNYKANEFFNWMFYYAKYCLSDMVLDPPYYQHFMLLVDSMEILYGNPFTIEQLEMVKFKLNDFVQKYETLYGPHNMFYNVHLLTHITDNAKYFGPLHATSLFTFENMNAVINSFINGPKGPTVQICVKHYLFFTNYYSANKKMSKKAINFCSEIINKGSRKYKYSNENRRKQLFELPLEIENNFCNTRTFFSYQKYYIQGKIITTDHYSSKSNFYNDSFIFYQNKFISIIYILKLPVDDNSLYIVGKQAVVNTFSFINNYFELQSLDSIAELLKIEHEFQKCICYKTVNDVTCLIKIKNCLIVD